MEWNLAWKCRHTFQIVILKTFAKSLQ
ncbi:hypothetical protein A2U01_0118512, partial [Trifolium medium]|nr:hypothetical protein [Trifolium medium]